MSEYRPGKHAHGAFDARPSASGQARLLVDDAVRRWGLPEAQLREEALLLTSELVSNAISHCDRRVQIHVNYEDGVFRVEVVDDDPYEPCPLPSEALSEKGRGLTIVEALAARWGVKPDESGKRVWFELDVRADVSGNGQVA